MAYQQQYNDDEEQQQSPQQGQVLTSDNSSGIAAPASSTSNSNTPSASNTGTGFTNFSRYVNANKDQSAKMAGDITSGLQSNIDSTTAKSNEFFNKANAEIANKTIKDSGLISQFTSQSGNFGAPDFKNQYQAQTQGWTGPNSVNDFSEYSDLSNQVKKNEESVKNLNAPGSIQALTKEQYKGQPNYTQGQSLLDAFLTSTGEGANRLNQFKTQYNDRNIQKNFSDLTELLKNNLESSKKQSEDVAKATSEAKNQALANFERRFGSQQQDLVKENQKAIQDTIDLRNALKKGDINAAQTIGLDPEVAKILQGYGSDLSTFVSGPASARSLGDIADKRQVQNYLDILGLDNGQSAFDFTATGNAAPKYNVDSDKVSKSKEFADLMSSLGAELKDKQSSRYSDYEDAKKALSYRGIGGLASLSKSGDLEKNAKLLGLSPDQYRKAITNDLLTTADVSRGKDLNLGDIVGNRTDRYSQLITDLGLATAPSLADIQDEGNAYSLNPNLLQRILNLKDADVAPGYVPSGFITGVK